MEKFELIDKSSQFYKSNDDGVHLTTDHHTYNVAIRKGSGLLLLIRKQTSSKCSCACQEMPHQFASTWTIQAAMAGQIQNCSACGMLNIFCKM